MSKMSLWDKWKILIEVSKSSYWFIIVIILLGVLGFIFMTTNKRNAKINKRIYIIFSVVVIALLCIIYHSSITNIFDYMMNNLFIAIYFPNLAIYFAAMIIMNIILWVSLFHFQTAEIIKKINIVVYIAMNYLLALILSVVNADKLDVFTQSSIYNNKKATALIELSSLIFIVWIIFLILYKIILIYIRKDYKPKVKKVIVKKTIKKLPDNYLPTTIPNYIYGKVGKTITNRNKTIQPFPEINSFQLQVPTETTVNISKSNRIEENEQLTREFEKMLTVDDYRLLLKLLKEQKEKEKLEEQAKKEAIIIEQEKQQLLHQKQIQQEREKQEVERQQQIRQQQELERQRQQAIILEQQRQEALRLEQIRIEELKKQELEKEQEKFTELELLYRGIQ